MLKENVERCVEKRRFFLFGCSALLEVVLVFDEISSEIKQSRISFAWDIMLGELQHVRFSAAMVRARAVRLKSVWLLAVSGQLRL